MNNTEYCPFSGKEKFLTRQDATMALASMKKRKRNAKSGGVYKCEHCGGFHLTHHTYGHSREMRVTYKKRSWQN